MAEMRSSHPTLSSPIQIGSITLSHRIVMAPMTRLRASNAQVPMDMMKTYYCQRATTPGTLLITEAVFVSPESRGRDMNAPGVFDVQQIDKWRTIVDAVHKQSSFVFCQLWHVGRAARAHELQRLGLPCVSSSAMRMPTPTSTVAKSASKSGSSSDEYLVPHAMNEDEIQEVIKAFATAAKNAVHGAGFDGVEIHAANGYLVDQFTQPTCNQRADRWGGSIENRSRFCLEVTRAVSRAIGADKTGVRLSPFSPFQGMGMDNPIPQFRHLIERLREEKLAYLHLVEPRVSGNVDRERQQVESLDFAFEAWNKAGAVILAGGYTPASARKAVEEDYADDNVAIAFGRHFISNPDLPRRVLNELDLSPYHRATFYEVGSPRGYIDYEFMT